MEISEETYQQAKIIAEKIRKELEPLILGKRRPALRCNCGAISHSKAEAIAIEPAGDPPYQNQVGLWHMWRVVMRDESGSEYVLGVEQFIPQEQLKEGFRNHFTGIDVPVSRW